MARETPSNDYVRFRHDSRQPGDGRRRTKWGLEMILPKRPHPWAVTVHEAREIQQQLSSDVTIADGPGLEEIRLIAGFDNGYVKQPDGHVAYAAVVVFTFPELVPVETAIGEAPVVFPYVPGFLTFREGPAILDALAKLASEPDVLLLDGQGYAHPRRMGLATHMGVVLDWPTIGCAKTRLVGTYEEPADEAGAISPLIDREEIVGAAVRTRPGHSPLFVSPGHKLDVERAVQITLACCRDGNFLPVPTQAAHDTVSKHTAQFRRNRSALSSPEPNQQSDPQRY
jgi:deoxyribonuclease V